MKITHLTRDPCLDPDPRKGSFTDPDPDPIDSMMLFHTELNRKFSDQKEARPLNSTYIGYMFVLFFPGTSRSSKRLPASRARQRRGSAASGQPPNSTTCKGKANMKNYISKFWNDLLITFLSLKSMSARKIYGPLHDFTFLL
jgi:hypothetical protein